MSGRFDAPRKVAYWSTLGRRRRRPTSSIAVTGGRYDFFPTSINSFVHLIKV